MKNLIFILLTFSYSLFAQYGRPAKEAPHTLGSAGNFGLNGTETHMWTIGELVVFTGTDSGYNFTQGFHQPMICKTFPVITSFNETSCSLPYTLSTTGIFHVYRWKTGNRTFGEQKSNQYLPTKSGNYQVFVGDSTGCVLLSSAFSVDLSGKDIIPIITTQGSASQDTLLKTAVYASYQWYVISPDGQHRAIVGETNQTFRPYFMASYYVKINTIDQCVSYSAPYTPINNTLEPFGRYVFESTDSTINFSKFRKINDAKLVAVYPIPVQKEFTVDFESPYQNTVQMTVYNAEGKLVNSKFAKNEWGKLIVKFDRQEFPSGKYILTVADGDKKFVKNLIFE